MPLPALPEAKSGTKISDVKGGDKSYRPPVMVSAGPILEGAAMPHADQTDSATTAAGARKRFVNKPPIGCRVKKRAFRRFVRRWIRKNLIPLSPQTDTTCGTWLDSTDYPKWRRDELMAVCEDLGDWDNLNWEDTFCKSFVKDEVYPEYKHCRIINSRTDRFKVVVGPIFRLIEKELFKLPWFIKRIPTADRPNYIMDRVWSPGCKYFATDYSSYEAAFTSELMEACEFELYLYMVSRLPNGLKWFAIVKAVLAGETRCVFKRFYVIVLATRMSGEMCTSLGNGFTNLMISLFVFTTLGYSMDQIAGVVEGDDGLFRISAAVPTEKDYEDLGLIIKIELHETISTASFCGLIFDETDRLNVTDPLEVLATFGWLSARYARAGRSKKMALLRCKALSLAYQYPGCPIIASLARYALRMTRSYSIDGVLLKDRTMSMWERTQLLEAVRHPIVEIKTPINTRLLVESRYGITIAQQLLIEKELDEKQDLHPIQAVCIRDWIPKQWKHYYGHFVVESGVSSDWLHPTLNYSNKRLSLDAYVGVERVGRRPASV